MTIGGGVSVPIQNEDEKEVKETKEIQALFDAIKSNNEDQVKLMLKKGNLYMLFCLIHIQGTN